MTQPITAGPSPGHKRRRGSRHRLSVDDQPPPPLIDPRPSLQAMGNSPSVQEPQQQQHAVLDANHPFRRTQLANEAGSGRQQSITSQLFPSRNTRHAGSHSVNAKRNRHHHAQPPSLFKSDYSLESTAEEAPAGTRSTEDIRDNMAGLSLKTSNEGAQVPPFLTPGHSTPTVQPTRQAAVLAGDLNNKLQNDLAHQREPARRTFQNRPSVVALKKTLLDDGDLHSTSSRSTSADVTSSTSLDIYSALHLKSPNHGDGKARDTDADADTSDFDDISDDGYLQSEDVVLNQSLLQNVLRRDMKRKRPAKNKAKSPDAGHASNLKVSSNSVSYDSLENGNVPDTKKMKSLSYDGSLPTFQSTSHNNDRLTQLARDNGFNRIDSFEKGSVEHREIEESSPALHNSSSISPSSSSILSNTEPEKVKVILKWRDPIRNPSKCKITIISTDIASALNFDPSDKSFHGTFSMKFDERENNFYVPNLSLPPGVYKFQFVINGEIRHSNLLPSATDSVGNIVNWFEVVPGYETVEPFRNEIDYREDAEIDPSYNSSDSNSKRHNESPGKVPLVQPVPGRPPLAARHTSSYSNKQERSGTPYSDYTGVSRSNSTVRKSPLIHQTLSSIDLVTALQPKKYEYSNEIPELFKAGNVLGQNDENQFPTPPPPPPPANPPSYDQPNFLENVVDCNQDNLFASLQQGGLLDAETAEQLFLDKYTVPDLPIYLNSTYLNKIFNEFQKHNSLGNNSSGLNHIIPHVNLNHLLTSSIRDEMISVGCTTRYEGKFITQVVYAPCYYASGPKGETK